MTTPSPHRGWTVLATACALWWRSIAGSGGKHRRGAAGGPSQSRQRPDIALQHRRPMWLWQPLAWFTATSASPVFVLGGGLLLIDPHSDHPLFWWSLPAIVALSNAAAIQAVQRAHRRLPFLDREAVSHRHASLSRTIAAVLFLLSGCVSGFLPDMVPALFDTAAIAFPLLADALACLLLAAGFALLAHPFSGSLHALLGFEAAS